MGNKNDYLTLEESAEMLDRPVSFLKTFISQGKLSSAKVVGGRWKISVRDLDRLKSSMPPEPQRIENNILSDIPPKEPQRVSKTEPVIEVKEPSAGKAGPSNFSPRESELRKQVEDLNKQIRSINDQIRAEQYRRHKEAVRLRRHPSKATVNALLLYQQQLKKQRHEAEVALSQEIQARKEQARKEQARKEQTKKAKVKQPKKPKVKQPKKPKVKQPKNKAEKPSSTRARGGYLSYQQILALEGSGRRLHEQIKALDREIKPEATRYEEATLKGEFYDVEILKSLVLKRADLEKQYAKIPDVLGRMPRLPPRILIGQSKASQQKNKAPKPPTGQASSVPPTTYLSWQVLPPGEWSNDAIRQHYDRLERQKPQIKYERERINKALSLNPEQWYVGNGEFEGYSVFTFTHTPKALLECPIFGNAIYIINSDWKRLSKKSKKDLKRSPEVTKIVHKGDWFQRVKRNLRSR